jgi:hypothetical protein
MDDHHFGYKQKFLKKNFKKKKKKKKNPQTQSEIVVFWG